MDALRDLPTGEDPVVDPPSRPFVGRWNHLVSNTNWEKGRIIHQWREQLRSAGAAPAEFSDEGWSRKVGSVTSQHVGRLRRVFERFGESHEKYPGLYWSHFHAALDWDDAEMWLEGAVQNKWSVSRMRNRRWETLGQLEEHRPRPEDVVSAEVDEDFAAGQQAVASNVSAVKPVGDEAAPASDDGDPREARESSAFSGELREVSAQSTATPLPSAAKPTAAAGEEPKRHFEELPELPEDVLEAFEQFKLLIVRHRANQWRDIPAEQLCDVLESLKQLALAPVPPTASDKESGDSGDAPF